MSREKKEARARAKRTGERYTTALMHVRHMHKGTPCEECYRDPNVTR